MLFDILLSASILGISGIFISGFFTAYEQFKDYNKFTG